MNCGFVGPPGGRRGTGPVWGVWLIEKTPSKIRARLFWHASCYTGRHTSKIRANMGWHACC